MEQYEHACESITVQERRKLVCLFVAHGHDQPSVIGEGAQKCKAEPYIAFTSKLSKKKL